MSSSSGGTMNIPQGRADVNPQQIQKLLDENAQIIKALIEAQNLKGKSMDIIQYQQILHRNLVYLAGLADPRIDIHQILPAPGSSNLLQSQRAPPPNQTVSAAPQNMTPPPSSMTSASVASVTSGMSRPPNATVTTPMGQSQWGNPPSSTMPQQMMGQYGMKGYAPAPWLPQPGQMPANYGMQQRMQMDRRQQLLRIHQERLIRAQQVRQMQQTSQPQAVMPPGMPHPPQPNMYPPHQGGYMGGAPQGGPMGHPPYGQPPTGIPPGPNMSQMDM